MPVRFKDPFHTFLILMSSSNLGKIYLIKRITIF